MAAFQFVLVIALVALTARSQQNSPQEPSAQPQPVLPASCPITRRPAKEFIAPIPYVRDENSFWLGTEPGSDPGHCRRKIAVTRIELRSKGVNRLVYKRGCQEHFSPFAGNAGVVATSSPSHHGRRSSGVLHLGCSIAVAASSLVATTPISFETHQAVRLYGGNHGSI